MKRIMINILFMISVFTMSGLTLADASFHRDGPRLWTCRATATDGSGIFFLGMGSTQAEAYIRAFENCNRMNYFCRISCRPEF